MHMTPHLLLHSFTHPSTLSRPHSHTHTHVHTHTNTHSLTLTCTPTQDLWIKLNTTRLATAAAINGNSPAGGCLIALATDERVMADTRAVIGLNETKLGIVAPDWFVDSFRAAVGQRDADRMLQLGSLVAPQRALEIGLVDHVCAPDDVVDKSVALLQEYIAIPEVARVQSRLAARKHFLHRLTKARDSDIDFFVSFITEPKVQKSIGMYLQSLAKRQ